MGLPILVRPTSTGQAMRGEAQMGRWALNVVMALFGVGFAGWGAFILKNPDDFVTVFSNLLAGGDRTRRWNMRLTGLLFLAIGTVLMVRSAMGPMPLPTQ